MVAKMKNCPSCGRIFVPMNATQRLCPDSMEKLREKEHEVVEYVRDHPKIKVNELIEATGAPESMIKRMIREGRFIQVGVRMTYPCEKCGAPITQGKLCIKCAEALKNELQSAAAKIVADRDAKRVPAKRDSQEHASAFRSERDRQGGSAVSKRYRGLH